MNKVTKVLIIFVTVASLSFMALMGAVTLGGPNWWGKAGDMPDYTFTKSAGETVSYSVTHRPSDSAVGGSSPILAQTVVAAMDDEHKRLDARDKELDDAISREENRIKILQDLQKNDLALLETRSQEFQDQLNLLNTTITTRNGEIEKLLQETITLDETLGDRREDVLRLKDQLALVRTDRDRLLEERSELEDILALYQASISQLERRTQQLQNQN